MFSTICKLCLLMLTATIAVADEKQTVESAAAKSPAQIRAEKMDTLFSEFGFRLDQMSTQPKIGEHNPLSGLRIEPEKVIISQVQARTWKTSGRKSFRVSRKYEVSTREDLEKLLTTSQFQRATIIDFHYVMESGEPSSFSFVRRSEIERARNEQETRVIIDVPFGVAPTRSANGQ